MTCTLDLYNVTCTLDPADQHGPTGYNTGIFFRQSQVQYCVFKCAVATSTRVGRGKKNEVMKREGGSGENCTKFIHEFMKKDQNYNTSNLQWKELLVVAC